METLDDAIVVRHHFQERLTVPVVVEPQIDRGFDRTTKTCMIQHGSEAGDDTTVDEALNPRSGRIRTQSDHLTDLTMGHSGVALKITEDFSVDIVYHSGLHCNDDRATAFSVPHTAHFPS